MRVVIEFDADNAAFEDFNYEVERVLARALVRLARQRVDGESAPTSLMDTNGNKVGTAVLHKD